MMAGKVMDTGALVAQTKMGETVNSLPLAIGRYDEVDETNTNTSWQTAQELRYPLTVNGRLTLDSSGKATLGLLSIHSEERPEADPRDRRQPSGLAARLGH